MKFLIKNIKTVNIFKKTNLKNKECFALLPEAYAPFDPIIDNLIKLRKEFF
jgi:hypothetical protein